MNIRGFLKGQADSISFQQRDMDESADVLLRGMFTLIGTRRIPAQDIIDRGEATTIERYKDLLKDEMWRPLYGDLLHEIQTQVYGLRALMIVLFKHVFGTDDFQMNKLIETMAYIQKIIEDLDPKFPEASDGK